MPAGDSSSSVTRRKDWLCGNSAVNQPVKPKVVNWWLCKLQPFLGEISVQQYLMTTG